MQTSLMYSYTVQGVRSEVTKTERIFLGCMIKFLWPTLDSLQMYNEGTVSSPRRITSVSKFSPQIYKHGGCKCNRSSSYPPSEFRQIDGQWCDVNKHFYAPSEEIKQCNVRHTRWPSEGRLYGSFSVELPVRSPPLQCKNEQALCSVLLEKMSLRPSSFNWHEKYFQHA
jgi:hypothetical protein